MRMLHRWNASIGQAPVPASGRRALEVAKELHRFRAMLRVDMLCRTRALDRQELELLLGWKHPNIGIDF